LNAHRLGRPTTDQMIRFMNAPMDELWSLASHLVRPVH
jgi:hypothetical protein